MTRLTVLFDYRCGLCQRARRWLEAQPKFVELEFIAAGSDHAKYRFPTLPGVASDTVEELVVVGDDGAIYRGDRAWIMCLYALVECREWAERLASPRLLPLARAAGWKRSPSSSNWSSSPPARTTRAIASLLCPTR